MSAEEVISSIESRRSIRAYRPDTVPDDIVDRIVEAGTYAATGMGRQSPIIIAVRDRTMRDRLSEMNARIMGAEIDPFYGAPMVLVVLADSTVPRDIFSPVSKRPSLLPENGTETAPTVRFAAIHH